MMNTGIYEILNTVNGKRYIGSAVNFKARWAVHTSHLTRGLHHSPSLQRAWNKYGSEAFLFKPLLICAPTNLLFYEQRCLDGYTPEYNICKIANSSLGVKRTDETKARISASKTGKKMPPRTPEHAAKLSAAMKGKQLGLGRVNSPEARERMRQAALRREKKPLTEKQRAVLAKMAEINRGRPRPEQSLRLMGNQHAKGNLGKKKSAAHVANMSAAQLVRSAARRACAAFGAYSGA